MLQASTNGHSINHKLKSVSKTKRIAEATWELNKCYIVQLYIYERRCLTDVIDHMQSLHGFVATKSQYSLQLKKWGLQKNTPLVKHKRSSETSAETNDDVRSPSSFLRNISPISSRTVPIATSRHLQCDSAQVGSRSYDVRQPYQTPWPPMTHYSLQSPTSDCHIASRQSALRPIDGGPASSFGLAPVTVAPTYTTYEHASFGHSERSCDSGFYEDPSIRVYGEKNSPKTRDFPDMSYSMNSEQNECHKLWHPPHSNTDPVTQYGPSKIYLSAAARPEPDMLKASESHAQKMHIHTRQDPVPPIDATMTGASKCDLAKTLGLARESRRTASMINQPSPDDSSLEEHCDLASTTGANDGIREWILRAGCDAERVSSLPLSDMKSSTSTPTPPFSALQRESGKEILESSTTSLLVEMMDILASRHRIDSNDPESTSHMDDISYVLIDTPNSAESPRDTDSSSGPSSSSKSSVSFQSSSGSSQSLKRSYAHDWRSSEGRDDDDEPPSKKPNREAGHHNTESRSFVSSDSLMPCPLFESQDCQGTNGTISELVRDLKSNHQIIICVECSTLLEYPEDARKADKTLGEHRASGKCNRRCISQSCFKNGGPPHLRTPDCPSLRVVAPELWRFIWNLTNPGQEAPALQCTTGVSYLHDKARRPRTQRTKSNRAQEIVQKIREDLEAKERRIIILESELEASNNRLIHTQREHEHYVQQLRQESDSSLQQCSQRVKEQEEIILDLLERFMTSGKALEQSLQRRLDRVCPGVFEVAKTCAKQVPPAPASAPTPASSQKLPHLISPYNLRSPHTLHEPYNLTDDWSTWADMLPMNSMQEMQGTLQTPRPSMVDSSMQNFSGQNQGQDDFNLDPGFDLHNWAAVPETGTS